MSDVEQAINEEYGARIQACERLFQYAKRLTTSWPGRDIKSTADGLIMALFGRSLDTFAAAVHLAKLGYGAQAAMLNRSLFEDMIDIHWVATEPEKAEERYRDHYDHGRMLLADAVAKYPNYYDIERPDFDPDERKRLDRLYGRWGAKPWSGIKLHERVRLVEHHWKDEAWRETLHFFHDIAHRENNQVLHVSSAGLSANAEVSDDGDSFTLYLGPRPKGLARTLFGAFWSFDNTVGLLLDHFEIEVDDKTRMEVFSPKDFVKLSDEQMRETGRNDPCPCGSGLKFKRCHGA
jgi:Family of unknown function (DUF5677)/SEC-C motif